MSETARIEEAMKDYWGERCSESDTECDCCAAWNELDELTALREENERLRVDAERLDWLETQDCWIGLEGEFEIRPKITAGRIYGKSVRAAIDSALATQPNNSEGR